MTSKIDMANLGQVVADARVSGLSYGKIRKLLESEHDLIISRSTVRDWLKKNPDYATMEFPDELDDFKKELYLFVDLLEQVELCDDCNSEYYNNILSIMRICIKDRLTQAQLYEVLGGKL